MHLRKWKKAVAAQRGENERSMEQRVGVLLFVMSGSESPFTYSGSGEGPYRNVGPPVLPSWAAWLGIWDVSGPGADVGVPVVGEGARSASSVFPVSAFVRNRTKHWVPSPAVFLHFLFLLGINSSV